MNRQRRGVASDLLNLNKLDNQSCVKKVLSSNLLDKSDDFLSNQRNPTFDELLNWNKTGVIKPLKHGIELPDNSGLEEIFNLYSHLPKNSNLILVGNGTYPIYLILKGFLKETNLYNKILYLPVSRDLAAKAAKSQALDKFYAKVELEKMVGNTFVFDSLSKANKGDHSLLDITKSIRRYLSQYNDSLVIPYGTPESGFPHSYALKDLKSFFAKENTEENYYLSPLEWDEISSFYDQSGNMSYWMGKYIDVDLEGYPITSKKKVSKEKQKKVALNYREFIDELLDRIKNDDEISDLILNY